MERLKQEEENLEVKLQVEEEIIEVALPYAQHIREKQEKLYYLRKLLCCKEKKMFKQGIESIKELKRLEALKRLNQEISSINLEALIGATIINQSSLQEVPNDIAISSAQVVSSSLLLYCLQNLLSNVLQLIRFSYSS